jgi:hypothetical protein
VFATIETILFAWVFGMNRAWEEIGKGAEMRVPAFFYPIIKYVTPTFLLLILVGYTFQPEGKVEVQDPKTGEVSLKEKGWEPYLLGWATGQKIPAWKWSGGGMIGKLLYRDLANQQEQLSAKLAGTAGAPLSEQERGDVQAQIEFLPKLQRLRTIDRLVMIGTFIFFSVLVAVAWHRRAAAGATQP